MSLGDAAHLRVLEGAVKTADLVVPNRTFALNTALNLYGHVYDEGGNWLNLQAVDWRGPARFRATPLPCSRPST